ncbi:MAG: ABC transporter ATP-binding protein [Pseudotabrizicola sp.]|uniref:ABC transporter ATP-binding protein n=1 Tax=Pseudotabrizicola sp. TaxID=2939647 RepID=UPI0027244AFC|nr:ABC transporter ATP-binding protein [Pseudotabrizicola sp.]MDO8883133.1 ABC transporter ATP-binding protein [Pseudotabrizicola sp.]MDP2081219.1 ABC transporter ATP-binding protein [Pseudotabrizicola sp.]MDZ7576162.1 ABC transporter ATP-binding protein [Pseudotabrizicola sp.]
MLRVDGITAGYGPVTILRDLSFQAAPGQVTCIMGRNGAGKSTLMKAIMGLVPVQSGQISLSGVPVHSLPAHKVPLQGIAYVPQGRRLFGPLTVAENIEIGLFTRKKGLQTRNFVLDLFPRLAERLDQVASTLSGGEQQMLAIARALCLEPSVLLLDEPTEGLQPSMIALIRDTVLRLRETGLATVLVEQRMDTVMRMADRVAFMAHGRVEADVARDQLTPDSSLFQQFVGV